MGRGDPLLGHLHGDDGQQDVGRILRHMQDRLLGQLYWDRTAERLSGRPSGGRPGRAGLLSCRQIVNMES